MSNLATALAAGKSRRADALKPGAGRRRNGLRRMLRAACAAALAMAGCRPNDGASQTSAAKTAPTPASQCTLDGDADRQLKAIGGRHAADNFFEAAEVQTLVELDRKYPDCPLITPILTRAMLGRKDWGALIELARRDPATQADGPPRVRLAMLHINANRYEEAEEILEPMRKARGKDAQLAWLAGYAAFYRGDYARCGEIFDGAWAELMKAGYQDAVVLRGLSFYHQDQIDHALALLGQGESALADNASFNNAYGRVLAAAGQAERSRIFLDRGRRLLDQETAMERHHGRLNAQAHLVNDAVNEQRYADAERIVQDMLTQTDGMQKAQLYQRLGEIYRQTGREELAQKAEEQAVQYGGGKAQ